jgi:hypothetical protein
MVSNRYNIKASLAIYGFELIINNEMELVENIKKVLIEFVYNPKKLKKRVTS